MVFIIFIILLAIFADSIWCFVIPCLCLVLRAAYKGVNINVLRINVIAIAFVIFLVNVLFANIPTNESMMLSLRIVVFSALFNHIIDSINKRSLKSTKGSYLYIYMMARTFSIISERQSDTWHIYNVRRKQTKLLKQPKLLLFTFSNFILEMITVEKQINLVNYEKGGLSNNKYSKNSSNKKAIIIPLYANKKISLSYSTIGDIACLLLILLAPTTISTISDMTTLNKNLFLPESIIKLIQF